MARTLKDLAADLRKYGAQLPLRSNQAVQRAALEAVYYLVYQTPVDTSQALSNWQIGLGQRVELPRAPYFPGVNGDTRNASAAAAIAEAEAILAGRKPGQTVFISNALPYISALNNGSSTQNPGGFVEAAALLGAKYIEKNGLTLQNATPGFGGTP